MGGMSTLPIPLAFIAVVSIVAFAVTGMRAGWRRKLPYVVLVPLFGLVLWFGISSYQGWPTRQPLPDECEVMGSIVREPSRADEDPGAIFIWAVPLEKTETSPGMFEYRPSVGEPRAFARPYERRLHTALEQARAKAAQGIHVRLKKGTITPKGPNSPGFSDPNDDDFTVHELAPPPDPPKRGN